MHKLENTKISKNLALIKNFKSYIRFNFSKNLFIIDDNNNLNIFLKPKSRKINQNLPKEGTSHLNITKKLKHKRLKSLIINANIPRNPIIKNRHTNVNSLKSFLKIKDTEFRKLKIVKPVKGGFYMISREGILGFLHKKQIVNAIKCIVLFLKSRATTVSLLSLWQAKHSVLSVLRMEFLATLKKIKFTLPNIRTSPKYFIPKHGGKFNVTYSKIMGANKKNSNLCKKLKKN